MQIHQPGNQEIPIQIEGPGRNVRAAPDICDCSFPDLHYAVDDIARSYNARVREEHFRSVESGCCTVMNRR